MTTPWPTVPLGELCQTGAGGTPPKLHKDYYEGGTIPWLLSGEVNRKDIESASSFITKKGLDNSSAKIFPPGTVLVAMYGATAGQVGILRFEAASNQAVCGIYPGEKFVPEFLFHLLSHRKDELVAQASGNAQPNISQIKIRSTPVPVVPIAEQRRIVAILDEAFASIAIARANAEKNLQNARELFEKQLDLAFATDDQGLNGRKLGDLITIQNGFAFKSGEYASDGHFLIRIGNVGDGEINLSNPKYVSLPSELERFALRADDILVSLTGNVGRVGMIRLEHLPAALNQRVARLTVRSADCEREFIYLMLRSGWFRRSLERAAHGAAQQNVSTKEIESLVVSVPSLDVQRRTVATFQSFAEEARRLGEIYKRKLDALDELKQSLLHEAFSGKL